MAGVDAVVLAGSTNTGQLRTVSAETYEALVPIAGKPMVTHVVDALLKTPVVNRIVVAGPVRELKELFPSTDRVVLAPAGKTAIMSFLQGAKMLNAGKMLIVTSDIPLLTPDAVGDFVHSCTARDGEFYYSVVSKEVNDSKFPGVKRTYVKLKEGTFTGGNIFLVDYQAAVRCARKAEEFVALRKSPFQLARLIGWKFLLKFLFGNLTFSEVEEKVSRVLGLKGIIIISNFPEVGIDVDKISDFQLVRSVLRG